jgi:hypothetical protein
VFAGAFAEYRPPVRPNYAHNFPYAGALDRWLPGGLAAVSLVWLVLQVVTSNDAGVGWAIPLRLALAGVGFLLVMYPIGWLGMSFGCRRARFQQPPDPGKRVVAANLFPYVLLLVIWMLVGSLGGAVPGVVVAAIVAVLLAWLVYRPTPDEAAVSLSAAGAAFVAGAVVCGLLAVGVNEAVRVAVRSGKKPPQLASSPVGPGLAWDAPPKPPPPAPKPRTPAATPPTIDPPANDPPARPGDPAGPEIAAGPPAATPPVTTAPATRRAVPPRPLADPLVDSPLFRRPDASAAATPPPAPPADPLNPNDPFAPAPSAPTPPEPGPPDPGTPAPVPPTSVPPGSTPAVAVRPGTTPPTTSPPAAPLTVGPADPVADRIRATGSPLVAEVRPLGAIKPFAAAVFPLTPSPVVLVTRRAESGAGDVGEVWDLTRFARVGAGPLPSGSAALALSPDGQTIARVTSFPSNGVETFGLGPARLPDHVPFPDRSKAGAKADGPGAGAQPQVVGFAGDQRLIVRWTEAGRAWVQVLNLRTKAFGPPVELPEHVPTPGNQAVSPDGRYYAVAGTETDRLGGTKRRVAAIVDLGFGKGRNVPVEGVDLSWQPSGVAFSPPDGRRLHVLFEQDGNTIILTPNVPNERPIIVPDGKVPVANRAAAGRLLPLADGRSWLVGGNAVVDSAPPPRKLVGELGVGQPVGRQRRRRCRVPAARQPGVARARARQAVADPDGQTAGRRGRTAAAGVQPGHPCRRQAEPVDDSRSGRRGSALASRHRLPVRTTSNAFLPIAETG